MWKLMEKWQQFVTDDYFKKTNMFLASLKHTGIKIYTDNV